MGSYEERSAAATAKLDQVSVGYKSLFLQGAQLMVQEKRLRPTCVPTLIAALAKIDDTDLAVITMVAIDQNEWAQEG